MLYVSRLLSLGALTERQARAAVRFRRDPDHWRSRLPPTAWRLLHEILVEEAEIQSVEAREGWAPRSGKVVLGVLLTIMDDAPAAPPSAPRARDAVEDMRDRIEFLTGEDGEALAIMLEFDLSHTTARLFLILRRASGRALPRETIWRRLYAERSEADWPDDRIIDVLISRLRQRLAEHGRYEIATVRGAGFRLIDRAAEKSGSARAAS